jgi:hypothetical protein
VQEESNKCREKDTKLNKKIEDVMKDIKQVWDNNEYLKNYDNAPTSWKGLGRHLN